MPGRERDASETERCQQGEREREKEREREPMRRHKLTNRKTIVFKMQGGSLKTKASCDTNRKINDTFPLLYQTLLRLSRRGAIILYRNIKLKYEIILTFARVAVVSAPSVRSKLERSKTQTGVL